MNEMLAFLRRDFLIDASYPWSLASQAVTLVGKILLWFLAAGILAGRPIPGVASGYLPWVLIGTAGAMLFSTALSAFASRLRQEQFSGTLEILFTSNTPFVRAVLYSSAYDLARVTPQALILIGLAWWTGPHRAVAGHLPLLAAFTVLAFALFAGLGLLAAAAVLAWQRGDPLVTLVSGAATLFGTAYIPAEVLSGPLAHLPQLVPLTPTLAGLRGCILGTTAPAELLPALAIVGLEAAVLLPVGLTVFNRSVEHARRSGGLSRY